MIDRDAVDVEGFPPQFAERVEQDRRDEFRLPELPRVRVYRQQLADRVPLSSAVPAVTRTREPGAIDLATIPCEASTQVTPSVGGPWLCDLCQKFIAPATNKSTAVASSSHVLVVSTEPFIPAIVP